MWFAEWTVDLLAVCGRVPLHIQEVSKPHRTQLVRDELQVQVDKSSIRTLAGRMCELNCHILPVHLPKSLAVAASGTDSFGGGIKTANKLKAFQLAHSK